jgi:hypothetical protein
MRVLLTTLSLSLVLGGIACKKAETTPQKQFQQEQAQTDPTIMKPTTTRNSGQPEWVDNADRAGRLSAVGTARANALGDVSLQRTQATNRALAALALKLQANVESLYAEASATSESATGKKPSTGASQETMSVIRNLVSVKIKGAKIPSFWTDNQTGQLFVLAQLNDDSSYDILKTALKDQPLLQDGLKKLDAELDKRK